MARPMKCICARSKGRSEPSGAKRTFHRVGAGITVVRNSASSTVRCAASLSKYQRAASPAPWTPGPHSMMLR